VSSVELIRSLDDPRVAGYRKLNDFAWLKSEGLFVAEGRLVLRRLIPSTRFETQSILLTPAAVQSLGAALDATRAPIYVVQQELMNEIAGFNIHRGCLALGKRPAAATLDLPSLSTLQRVVVLEGVNNPDNVGGIFRSAAAFGADLVVLGPDCGDPLYRKAVRTSMAATLAVPFVSAGEWPGALTNIRNNGFLVVALTPDASVESINDVPADPRTALVLGAEGNGLSSDAMVAANVRVRIPTTSLVDSLNVTTAASIAMHHFFGRHVQ
jgi:tRNA G18 (ribose-2'-O)-methylase SpoU